MRPKNKHKIYTIKITVNARSERWYAGKQGSLFQAIIVSREGTPTFFAVDIVDGEVMKPVLFRYISLMDATIVSEAVHILSRSVIDWIKTLNKT